MGTTVPGDSEYVPGEGLVVPPDPDVVVSPKPGGAGVGLLSGGQVVPN